ncbi:cobalamin synthase [Hyphomicrobium nitrativorans NL23]|uniref:Adenosylcobinamide-GDP ribazoletransferase n=1 Tax=Hyphomicrobium nitrativorans NL23 TaxID=1029756 RepID=V5SC74_9HYPH|nr:adenosylcobinamide-GDP ribazoletransferase [Hyphomicrobium nitrativorans]AHB48486.1 cobalamin synthase [Hyphomicrobium nitrativorans NL23]
MTFRTFVHALQFLTRLPAPALAEFDPKDLSRSAVWFPLIGLIVGAFVAFGVWSGGHVSPWVGALVGLVIWVGITGALHLDGLGDVADGLGAAHRDPNRFLEVLRDPHVGAFGVITMALQLIAKLVLLAEVPASNAWALAALLLIPAWARWGTQVWSLAVPPLAKGSGERFSWQISKPVVAAEGLVLAAVSAWAAPALLGALLIVPLVAVYWKARLGGITGDCLGASVEITETLLLLLVVIAIALAR